MDHQTDQLKGLPVMRSRNRWVRSQQPPLVGRLHEMATTRPAPAPPVSQGWWQCPYEPGQSVIRNPGMFVLGQLGRGKSPALVAGNGRGSLARRRYFDALSSARPVVVLDARDGFEALDEMAWCERLDLSAYDTTINPLAFGPVPSSSSGDTAGGW